MVIILTNQVTLFTRQRTIGLQLDELDSGKHVISVAGGASKANAIAAYMKHRPSDVLITDEAAARKLLHVMTTLEERAIALFDRLSF